MSVERLYSHRESVIAQKVELHLNRTHQHEHDRCARAALKAKIMAELLPQLPKEAARAGVYADSALRAKARGRLSDAEIGKRNTLAFDVARSYARSNDAARAAIAAIKDRLATQEPAVHGLLKQLSIGDDPMIVKLEMERYQERKQAADRAAPAGETPK